jgi:hypothetical protein
VGAACGRRHLVWNRGGRGRLTDGLCYSAGGGQMSLNRLQNSNDSIQNLSKF